MEAPRRLLGPCLDGFGANVCGGENRKMVRKWLRTHQKSLKNYRIVEQVMADPIFGVPGPGGGPKRPKMAIFGFPENPIFGPYL